MQLFLKSSVTFNSYQHIDNVVVVSRQICLNNCMVSHLDPDVFGLGSSNISIRPGELILTLNILQ